jgi:anti-sigma regulatory factor (Ser/Thr protein kinase)
MRIELDNTTSAPAAARDALESWIGTHDSAAPLLDDALLVVSELVTNAVIHTSSDSVVTAAFDDCRLRIEVHDHNPHGPFAEAGATVDHLGLRVLAAHCDLWGWEPTAFGKFVWTETLC